MILNRKNRTNQRTIVERLRNVNFFMSSTVHVQVHVCAICTCVCYMYMYMCVLNVHVHVQVHVCAKYTCTSTCVLNVLKLMYICPIV